MTVEQIYEKVVKLLSVADRRQLLDRISRDLPAEPIVPSEEEDSDDWMSIRGIAPDLLDGEDAQEWITRTRHEGDERRERVWRQQS